MSRTTILFGNGLGMALNHTFFSLENALSEVWKNGPLNEEEKKLVAQCLGAQNFNQPPKGEHELDTLHRAVESCEFLKKIGDQWLTNPAKLLPDKVKQYLDEVAFYFHNEENNFYKNDLFKDFIDNLCNFIKKNQTHIATLNYDNLLYNALLSNNKVFGNYDEALLVDGFWVDSLGFKPSNLNRLDNRDFGWYLHLHGSPLFYDKDGKINKFKRLDDSKKNFSLRRHVVLTHFKHKQSVIANSELLTTYWEYFDRALRESKKIILFGYSGNDEHLNRKISNFIKENSEANKNKRDVEIEVIEWSGAKQGDQNNRESFWRGKLALEDSFSLKVRSRKNILEYQFQEES